jgi:uncharacterized protein with von Willebrand factor type A (vWA) domain
VSGGALALEGLVAFGAELRAAGLEVTTDRLQTALGALSAVDASDRDEAYWALQSTLVSEQAQVPAFDAAFAALWDGAHGLEPQRPQVPSSPALPRSPLAGEGGSAAAERMTPLEVARPDESDAETDRSEAGATWSPVERLRTLDFAGYGEEELERARERLERVMLTLPRRRTRRRRASPRAGADLDARLTLREAMRTEGHPLERRWRERKQVPRRLVFVVDVSGSMEPYVRAVLMLAQVARRASRRVEAFSFGTRLTRLTPKLGGADQRQALEAALRTVPDWAGGTRIGECLAELNETWGPLGHLRGAAVVIVSDGWERGDAALVGRETARLQRAAHCLLWVNPLLGDPGFEPLAAGMAAAYPNIDVFLPGHDLQSLEGLAAVLQALPQRRPRLGLGRGPVNDWAQ